MTKTKIKSFLCQLISLASLILMIQCLDHGAVVYAQGPTQVSGLIDRDTTWTLENSPYVVPWIVINKGVKLIIEPGVNIKFNSSASAVNVKGKLIAEGTSTQPIVLTSNSTDSNKFSWSGIYFINSEPGSVLKHVDIGSSSFGLNIEGNLPIIDFVSSHNNLSYGAYIKSVNDPNAQITNSQFYSNQRHGIYLLNSSFVMSNCLISNNGRDGLLLENSSVKAIFTEITGNNWSGIELTDMAMLKINNSSIYGNGTNITNVRYNTTIMDATNNWWGTTDPVLIARSIYYNNDLPYGSVIYTPFLDGPNGQPILDNYVYGHISENTVWTLKNSPYIVNGGVLLDRGVTLDIEPGVEVKFNPTYRESSDGSSGMTIRGTLKAIGTAEKPIVFTPNRSDKSPGNWSSILFSDGSQSSLLKYVTIEYANVGIDARESMPQIDHVTSRFNNSGINILSTGNSQNSITDSIFSKNFYGITITNCSPTITNSEISFSGQGGVGIDGANSSPILENNLITDNTNSGIAIATNTSSARLTHNTIVNNSTGVSIYLPSQSDIKINDNAIYNNQNYNLSLFAYNSPSSTVDVTNNWWGTIDEAMIGAKIYDQNDEAAVALANFIPYLKEDDTILLTNVSASPEFMSTQELCKIGYTLNRPAKVSINIYNFETKQLVRRLIENTSKPAGIQFDVFDAKDQFKQPLLGNYFYTISAVDEQGRLGTYAPLYTTGAVQLYNGTLTPAHFNPYKGEQANVTYNLAAPAFVTLRVGTGYGPFPVKTLLADTPRDRDSNIQLWDGRDESGQIVEQSDYSAAGFTNLYPDNGIRIVPPSDFKIESVKANPYAILPSYHSTTTVTYTITKDARVSVLIKNPQGNTVIRTLVVDDQEKAGSYKITWDGKDNQGRTVSAAGNYQITVLAADESGNNISRIGNITILENIPGLLTPIP